MAKTLAAVSGKEVQIIAMFQQGLEAKEVAKRLHFADHRQMANYMKSLGYVWNSEKKNYESTVHVETEEEAKQFAATSGQDQTELENLDWSPERMTSFLTFFEANKDTLVEIVKNHGPLSELPRYVIPGVYTTKSVYMNHNIDMLAREFSEEKNISQRDIFEIALIDFFKKYGFSARVKVLMGAQKLFSMLLCTSVVCLSDSAVLLPPLAM
ncbi:hypothetical protein [Gordoniibacillus kamchatkensis]|uniref:hypothetical protein n=1 Tax=Gordoniibacillus kamchatkensis TaxID=1590651 RepID=UPI00069712D2|nr:hypothetical protein [Paenibacillus sp. VKM B-2647]